MLPSPPTPPPFPYTTLFRSTSATWPESRAERQRAPLLLGPDPDLSEARRRLRRGGSTRAIPIRRHIRSDHRRRWLNRRDRKSTRLNSSHANISYAVFCLKKK